MSYCEDAQRRYAVPMGSVQDIGQRIRSAREAAGLSQLALAVAIRMTPSVVYRWEAGATRPGRDALPRIAEALGVSEDWLLTGRDAPSGANPATLSAIREFLASELSAGIEAWKVDALRQANLDALRPTLKTIYAVACATDWQAVAGTEERTTTRPALSRRGR